MNLTTLVPLLAIFIAGGVLGAFLVLLAGVRTEERQMSLTTAARTRSTAGTRWFLGVYQRGHHEPADSAENDTWR